MEKYIRKLGVSSIITSILLIILAFFMVFKPIGTANVLMLVLGYILVIDGLIHFISYFSIKADYRFFSYELAQAILYIVLGFIIVYNSNSITQALPVFLGIWIVIDSIFRIQIAFNISGIRNINWGVMLLMAFIGVLLGVVLIINPFSSLQTLTVISGALLMVSQLMDIYDDVFVLTQVGKVSKIVKNANGVNAEIIIEENTDDKNNKK